ncbi:hypothetical protein DM2_231 [Halorubrum sp. DM2]|uniref:hypothetical protein n=1 Tax=unclassified Halorubrum TaxID=2642239 RepID=UPI0003DC9E0F|nr:MULTISPECIES: hypothetical protein [unclassified Halorubrum]CDK40175.1 uncharacterized protein BN903_85 [Halorubrum sp. AJ67]VTT85349.1 hypothetical protein DM2_231 [Halorubrum sp. DM2]
MAVELHAAIPGALDRADLLLLAFPLLFVAVYGALALNTGDGIPPLAGASAVCCLLIVDGVFLNPPVDR